MATDTNKKEETKGSEFYTSMTFDEILQNWDDFSQYQLTVSPAGSESYDLLKSNDFEPYYAPTKDELLRLRNLLEKETIAYDILEYKEGFYEIVVFHANDDGWNHPTGKGIEYSQGVTHPPVEDDAVWDTEEENGEDDDDSKTTKKDDSYTSRSSAWDTGYEALEDEECPDMDVDRTLILYNSVYFKIRSMMDEMNRKEWMGYLKGFEDDGDIYIEDIYIPEQTVTSANVNNEEEQPEDSIGMVHSHHSMGAFWSGTDRSSIIHQNKANMVVDSDMEMEATTLVDLPCGRTAVVDADVLVMNEGDDFEDWAEEQEDKIQTKTYSSSYSYKKRKTKKKGTKKGKEGSNNNLRRYRNRQYHYPYNQ